MAIKSSDVRAASERVSSPGTSYTRGSGASSTDLDWAAQQEKIARALTADTDLVLYFAYLVSNRACAWAQRVARGLSELIVLVEGRKYPERQVEQPIRLQRLLTTLGGRTSLSDTDISRIEEEVATYTEQELAPQIARRGRAQATGQEATSVYATTRTEVVSDWKKLRSALSATIASRRFTQDKIRASALAVPLSALSQTATLLDRARLTDFTLQLSAATAATAAMGRQLDLKTRFRTGVDVFPRSAAVLALSSVDGFVTAVTTSPPPGRLCIRSGDTVVSGGGTATVLTVGDLDITLGSSSIVAGGDIEIFSSAYLAWATLTTSLDAPLALLPGRDDLASALQRLEGDGSAARLRALMEYMVKLATVLDEPSTSALQALERVGGTAYVREGTSVAGRLRAFSPVFGAKTRSAGDKLLRDLESRGFDYAVEMLYGGQVDDLLDATAAQASRVGRVTEISSTLGTYTGGARGVG